MDIKQENKEILRMAEDLCGTAKKIRTEYLSPEILPYLNILTENAYLDFQTSMSELTTALQGKVNWERRSHLFNKLLNTYRSFTAAVEKAQKISEAKNPISTFLFLYGAGELDFLL